MLLDSIGFGGGGGGGGDVQEFPMLALWGTLCYIYIIIHAYFSIRYNVLIFVLVLWYFITMWYI